MPIAYLMVKDAKCHSQKLYEMITNSVWTHHRTLERQTSVSDRKNKKGDQRKAIGINISTHVVIFPAM